MGDHVSKTEAGPSTPGTHDFSFGRSEGYGVCRCGARENTEAACVPCSGVNKKERKPKWIQGDNTPECCGQKMFFVGQLDEEDLWDEVPKDAKLWWHDVASFYVFTCPVCLNVRAVGQQY